MQPHDPAPSNPARRAFLGTAATASALFATGQPLTAGTGIAATEAVTYEITRSDADWRARLTEQEYYLLRETGTEAPKSHPMWNRRDPGHYHCKGCALTVYDATWKIVLSKGWLFFRHSLPNATLTDLDQPIYEQFGDGPDATAAREALNDAERATLDELTAIEVHCRRCGSHFGHILYVDDQLVHCVNGGCFDFEAQPA